MINVAYAAPYVPPVPGDFNLWQGMKHTWTGWDGSVWDLSDPESGVFLTGDGLEGLYEPDIVNYTHDSPVVHGVEWDGWLATGRKVYWNVYLFNDTSSQGWLTLNRAFRRTFLPGKTGVWKVELPGDAGTFSLTLRLDNTDSRQSKHDPIRRGWDVFPVKLFAEQPFWEGESVIEQWETGEQVDFFGAEGYGPPFFISPSSNFDTAVITNAGDVESYGKWTITGPATTVQVGVGDEVTFVGFEVPEGSKLILDSNPVNLIAELDGEDVMDQLPDYGPPPIPPGEDVKLGLAMDGTGKVQVEFKQLKVAVL